MPIDFLTLLMVAFNTASLVMIVIGYGHAKAVRRSELKIMRQYAKECAAAFKPDDLMQALRGLSLVADSAGRFAESRGISRKKMMRTLAQSWSAMY